MKLGEAMYKAQQEEGQAAPDADNSGDGSRDRDLKQMPKSLTPILRK